MFNVILFQPEIPPNTGNIIRLCANVGAALHLVHPLGFTLEHAQLRRAGLDYHELASVREHLDLAACVGALGDTRLWACSTRGSVPYHEASFRPGDAFLFGPETQGLPPEVLQSLPQERVLRIPMLAGNRSLNLSNAVAVVVYEAWRQNDHRGA